MSRTPSWISFLVVLCLTAAFSGAAFATLPPVPPQPPANLTLQCAADIPPPVQLTATDDLDGTITVSPSATITPGACLNDFTMVRTWTFVDSDGNTAQVSQTITVLDDIPPAAPAPPADLILQCAQDVPPPVSLTAVDNCAGDITVNPTTQITPGACLNDFVMVRTWTFSDTCGNTASVSQTITVLDDIPPVAPAPPADLILQCAQDVPPPVSLTAVDNCAGDITVNPTTQITPGACLNDFLMVRTWTFSDTCGNTASVSQTITVLDDIPPVAPAPPADLNLECSDDLPPPVSLTAVDNCAGDITVNPTAQITPGPGNGFTMIRTWTFADTCGNTSSIAQTIDVADQTPPSITCPSDTTIECGESTLPENTGFADCEDVCDPDVEPTFVDVVTPGSCPGAETITRTWTCEDDDGNTASCVQTIHVVDTTAPELLVELDRTELWPPNHKMVEICATVTVTDTCDGTVTASLLSVVSDEPDNDIGDGNTEDDIEIVSDTKFRLRSERDGRGVGRTYTISYRAVDCSGNPTIRQATVEVPHDQSGFANAAFGFNTEGLTFESEAEEFGLVIPSRSDFDVKQIDLTRVFVGNHLGYIESTRHSFRDVNGDRSLDLILVYDVSAAENLLGLAAGELIAGGKIRGPKFKEDLTNTLALRYHTIGETAYLVEDIFRLGPPRNIVGKDEDEIDDIPAFLEGPSTVAFSLPEDGLVIIDVFSVQGRKVRTLYSSHLSSGEHAFSWDGRTASGGRAANGIYFYRVVTPTKTLVRKIVVAR